MRLIERLRKRAENRPRANLWGTVAPWDNEWIFTLNTIKKGNCTTESKAFPRKTEAVEYAESVMKGKGVLNIVRFMDMDGNETPFTTADREAAAV